MNILREYLRKLEIKINEGEKSTLQDFTIVNDTWVRPEFIIQDFFKPVLSKPKEDGFYILPNGSKLLIDSSLEQNFLEFSSLPLHFKPDWQERKYRVVKTNRENQSDFEITSVFDFRSPNFMEEIAVTAGFLISEDIQNRGPLYELSKCSQENLNLGYISPYQNELKLVFVERKKPEEGKPREYHIHESDAPRVYKKKDRHFLAPIHKVYPGTF